MTQNSGEASESEGSRGARSWPVVADAEYKVLVGANAGKTGNGRTVKLSSTVILLESEEVLPVGNQIDLSIAWPTLLNQKVAVRLCVKGLIVEIRDHRAAVEILQYEFRTQPLVVCGGAGALS